MLQNYVPILVMFIFAIAISSIVIILSSLFGPHRNFKVKKEPYECGIKTDGAKYLQTSIKYYVVALLFLVFDLECVFLYPWAVHYKSLGFFGFIEMAIFILVLFICFIYVWKKGALEWD